MRDFRSILNILGLLLCIESIAMIIPMLFDLLNNNNDWKQFFYSSIFTFFIGLVLFISFKKKQLKIDLRQAFVLTITSWILIAIFGAIPFIYTSSSLSYTDAFFESVSGITTTGATVITNLDVLPEGILIWRSLLQWFGGIGIIVLAMAILPTLQIGGMQLLHMEHDDPYEKTIPKINKFVLEIFVLYVCLTLICCLLYYFNGMSGFDAIIHCMTTISTGGFSNHNLSFAYYNSQSIEYIGVLFMIIGSLPFVIYLQVIHGQKNSILKDDQIRLFFIILIIIIFCTILWLINNQSLDFYSSFRIAIFNIISILTGTGYSSSNFSNWGSFGLVIMIVIMFVGGCAGSTTGGIKIFRLQLLFRGAKAQIKKLTQPHAVLMMRFNGKTVTENTYNSIMGFFFMYIFLFILSAISLSFFSLDFLTSFSAAASAISNVGPGIGETIGPLGTYASIQNGAKWILSFTMLIGRLEIFTILVLFSFNFWKK
ncbi:MAG: Trk system potassium uptake protein TrkI [Alphaproteobacteria bacterium MarineAlpha5_Bin5]|nr:MAG: Trk system potassium uptake protein TrkI [Alphaproteobacteria bacterium MarineAlpha5_Bin5]|tara:strand:+ start:13169 stop:14617 length:1449 start_codon:yes stop_codon:yes gene_type:complete